MELPATPPKILRVEARIFGKGRIQSNMPPACSLRIHFWRTYGGLRCPADGIEFRARYVSAAGLRCPADGIEFRARYVSAVGAKESPTDWI